MLESLFRRLWVASILTATPALAGTTAPVQTPPVQALKILSDRPLPPGLVRAYDIRWASDRSLYLSLLRDGAIETPLSLDHPEDVKKVLPGMREPGGTFANILGASPQFLVGAGPLWVSWRAISSAAPVGSRGSVWHQSALLSQKALRLPARESLA